MDAIQICICMKLTNYLYAVHSSSDSYIVLASLSLDRGSGRLFLECVEDTSNPFEVFSESQFDAGIPFRA